MDAPLLAASFAGRGIASDILAVCLYSHRLVLNESLLNDVQSFFEGLGAPKSLVSEALELLEQNAEVGDEDGGEVIVTADADLLEMGAYEGIPILSPRGFWERLQQID